MPSTNPKVESFSCPGCGAQYEFPATMAGRSGRCAQCGAKFTVPVSPRPPGPGDPLPTQLPDDSAELGSQYIGVDCPRCQTRMYGLLHQVGQEMKCPDCGVKTVLPPPPPPKKKNIPAAFEGEQYELWEADEAPLPSVLYANQPKYIAVTCRRCDTVIYATEKQVGQTVVCPDCNTKHVVPQPTQPKVKRDVLARDAETPKLDPAAHPGERPLYASTSTHKMVYEEVREAEYARALEKSRRTGKPMEIDPRGRPIMPRWPLITGILPILVSAGVPVYWLALSAGLMAAGWVFITGLQMAMTGGMGAIAGMCFFAIGCVFIMLCAAACSSLLMQIVVESATGSATIQSWPSFSDWFGALLVFIIGCMVSAMPGWAIAQVPQLSSSPLLVQLFTLIGIGLCLPIVLLSQLDSNSPWGVVSGRVLASLAHCTFSWAFFYFASFLIAILCGLATFLVAGGDDVSIARIVHFRGTAISFVAGSNPLKVLWLMPLYIAALIIYARLLGRLAWRLAEAIPARD